MRFLYLVLFAAFLSSCSLDGIKVINQRDIYSAEFQQKIDSAQLIYRDGDKKLALSKLQQIPDDSLSSGEKAKKYNLMGVMFYSLGDLSQAIENFLIAKKYVNKDLYLKSQIHMNLASSYVKKNELQLAREQLKEVEIDYFKKKEKKNYFRLRFTVANQQNDSKTVVRSLIYLADGVESFQQFEDYKYRATLMDHFRKLSESERVHIMDKFEDDAPVAVAYLAKSEALNRFYGGNKSGAEDIVSWMKRNFIEIDDVRTFVEDYEFRVQNYSKINPGAVGVITPLSGRRAKFGKKVLAGINTVLSSDKSAKSLQIYVKDNQNNPFLAKKRVEELVMKHNVSVIIGGLFPNLAKEEYLEARKYGVVYISLSPVYLPRSEKSNLLIEISGSVESQIASVIETNYFNQFGRRVSILYPNSDEGLSYVNELWGLHNSEKIDLININKYKRGIRDYREPVKSLLGLKYPRERQEEKQIWSEIKNASKRSVRIVNVLPPVIDFDWVFIPSLPKEAIQIIPTFSFFDAKNLKFIGGPSWINKKILKERRSLGGKIYVIGNDTKEIEPGFVKMYKEKNGVTPHLVDTLAYEGMKVVSTILDGQRFGSRDELAQRIKNIDSLKGITSNWTLKDNLWLKKMDILKATSRGFNKLEEVQ